MAIYRINYINEGFFDKTSTRVSLADAKKARDILKKILRNFDIDTVRKTVEVSDDKKIEKSIKKGKDPVLALYRPIVDTTVGTDGSVYNKKNNNINPSKAELNMLKDDLIDALEKEGMDYNAKWGLTLFGQGLSIK